jgi:uncharacterized protein (TIGR03435 family)
MGISGLGSVPESQDGDPAPTVQEAVQEQLGLKLVDAKAPFDIVVVHHTEKAPTDN